MCLRLVPFVDCFTKLSHAFHEVSKIVRSNLFRMSFPHKRVNTSLKSNCSLFARLYVSCQVRDGHLDGSFCHEKQNFLPAMSRYGELGFGTESDLLPCLEKVSPGQGEVLLVDVRLLDGAVTDNMLKPGSSEAFEEYSHDVFLPYVIRRL